MELAAAQSLALSLMEAHGLRNNENFGTPKYWAFAWHNKRRSFGTCSYAKRTIFLSKPNVQINTEADVRDTILHEIAHAMAGPKAHHSITWKLIAKSIGANPQACSVSKETVAGKYQAICPGCGRTVHMYRRPKSTRNTACAICCNTHNGGCYTERFKLNFVEVR